jgi:hypothetical protein
VQVRNLQPILIICIHGFKYWIHLRAAERACDKLASYHIAYLLVAVCWMIISSTEVCVCVFLAIVRCTPLSVPKGRLASYLFVWTQLPSISQAYMCVGWLTYLVAVHSQASKSVLMTNSLVLAVIGNYQPICYLFDKPLYSHNLIFSTRLAFLPCHKDLGNGRKRKRKNGSMSWQKCSKDIFSHYMVQVQEYDCTSAKEKSSLRRLLLENFQDYQLWKPLES